MTSEGQVLKIAEPAIDAGIGADVERLAGDLSGVNALSAPVRMPPQEQLAVQLVNVSVLARLDEARDDANLFQNIFWCLFGLTFGVPVALALAPGGFAAVSESAIVAMTTLSVVTAGAGICWGRYSKRARILKERILQEATHQDVYG